jgi:hypothetical protein
MASIISLRCRGRDVHRDADVLNKLIVEDWDTMGAFMMFLQRTGCFKYGQARSLYSRWCSRTEATWMDEWKKWSQDERP